MTAEIAFNDRMLSLGLARVAEQAALACADLIGRGDEKAADQAAVNAMRDQLNMLNIKGVVVIGEGERDEAPMLFIGEEVGTGEGPGVDIALDPLEGTTLTAKAMPNALTVIAMAPRGTLLHAPDTYMDKLAIGPGYPEGVVSLAMSPRERVEALASARGCRPSEITVCVLERPRHEAMIAELRETGAAVYLITDGDVAGVIHCAESERTGIDMYMGTGGAPEGVLAGAARLSQRRRARPRRKGRDHRFRPRLCTRRDGDIGRDLCRHRRDRRLDPQGRASPPRFRRDRDGADALAHGIGAAHDLSQPTRLRRGGRGPAPAPPEYFWQDEAGAQWPDCC
jgi:fructose-1,6-bisphosphatase II / sedoheptulose-1,7-bisphosphatase